MKIRFLAVLVGFSFLFSNAQVLADDDVCIINNAGVAINASGGEGSDSTSYELEANAGDLNKCWAFSIGVGAAYYEIAITWGAGADAGNFLSVGFTDPDFGSGYFTTEAEGEGAQWSPGEENKICQGAICVYHTPEQGVWRLYVEDAPSSEEDCSYPLSPCYTG